jgi:hypothetical protein
MEPGEAINAGLRDRVTWRGRASRAAFRWFRRFAPVAVIGAIIVPAVRLGVLSALLHSTSPWWRTSFSPLWVWCCCRPCSAPTAPSPSGSA